MKANCYSMMIIFSNYLVFGFHAAGRSDAAEYTPDCPRIVVTLPFVSRHFERCGKSVKRKWMYSDASLKFSMTNDRESKCSLFH